MVIELLATITNSLTLLGTLVDSESIYTRVAQELASPYNKTFTYDIKQRVMGKSGLEACAIVVEALDLPFTPQQVGVILCTSF